MSEKDSPNTQNPADLAPESAESAEQKLAESEKKYLYLYADFDNFKKRAFKERQEALKFGWEPVARNLLEVLDNLERAFEAASKSGAVELLKGLEMVIREFRSTLTKGGVEALDTLNKAFDPHVAEAVGQIESDLPAGHVCAEITKGYSFHGRLLRPARVTVSNGNNKQSSPQSSPLTGGDPSPP